MGGQGDWGGEEGLPLFQNKGFQREGGFKQTRGQQGDLGCRV
jgi:hypothetical protein